MAVTLVAGGAGYIGSALVPRLVDEGHEVIVVDRLLYGDMPWPSTSRLELRAIDIRDLNKVDLQGVDHVVDLAALSTEDACTRFPNEAEAVNRRARIRLAQIAKRAGVRRYVLASSSNLYGSADVPVSEDAALNADSKYTETLRAAEVGVGALAGDGFCPVILRQATVFGLAVRMRFDLAINAMIAGIVLSHRCAVRRPGTQRRPFIWIKDLIDVQVAALARPSRMVTGQIINVGAVHDQYAIGDLPAILSDILGAKPDVEMYGADDPLSHLMSYLSQERVLLRRPMGSLEVGARELAFAIARGVVSPMDPSTNRASWLERCLASPDFELTASSRQTSSHE